MEQKAVAVESCSHAVFYSTQMPSLRQPLPMFTHQWSCKCPGATLSAEHLAELTSVSNTIFTCILSHGNDALNGLNAFQTTAVTLHIASGLAPVTSLYGALNSAHIVHKWSFGGMGKALRDLG